MNGTFHSPGSTSTAHSDPGRRRRSAAASPARPNAIGARLSNVVRGAIAYAHQLAVTYVEPTMHKSAAATIASRRLIARISVPMAPMTRSGAHLASRLATS